MIPIKVCFLGTPEFAATHLQTLLKKIEYQVVGVVTQPDRPAGRKLQLTPSAVKELAVENRLPVLTPENLKNDFEAFEKIKSWKADLAVVVAFGQILSNEFLQSFKYGAVNVHGSLLPKWRGAAPIQRSLEAGDTETGVTLQRMVRKLDAGPIIGKRVLELDDEMTASELYLTLAKMGCELLEDDLINYVKGKVIPEVQIESQVTYAKKIEKEEALINWKMSALQIHNRVRAFDMGPGTYIMFHGKRLKIHKTKIIDSSHNGVAGEIVDVGVNDLLIQTSSGVIALLEVQPESKSKMEIADFLKSVPLKKGVQFV